MWTSLVNTSKYKLSTKILLTQIYYPVKQISSYFILFQFILNSIKMTTKVIHCMKMVPNRPLPNMKYPLASKPLNSSNMLMTIFLECSSACFCLHIYHNKIVFCDFKVKNVKPYFTESLLYIIRCPIEYANIQTCQQDHGSICNVSKHWKLRCAS